MKWWNDHFLSHTIYFVTITEIVGSLSGMSSMYLTPRQVFTSSLGDIQVIHSSWLFSRILHVDLLELFESSVSLPTSDWHTVTVLLYAIIVPISPLDWEFLERRNLLSTLYLQCHNPNMYLVLSYLIHWWMPLWMIIKIYIGSLLSLILWVAGEHIAFFIKGIYDNFSQLLRGHLAFWDRDLIIASPETWSSYMAREVNLDQAEGGNLWTRKQLRHGWERELCSDGNRIGVNGTDHRLD